jgi:hypothetical protein
MPPGHSRGTQAGRVRRPAGLGAWKNAAKPCPSEHGCPPGVECADTLGRSAQCGVLLPSLPPCAPLRCQGCARAEMPLHPRGATDDIVRRKYQIPGAWPSCDPRACRSGGGRSRRRIGCRYARLSATRTQDVGGIASRRDRLALTALGFRLATAQMSPLRERRMGARRCARAGGGSEMARPVRAGRQSDAPGSLHRVRPRRAAERPVGVSVAPAGAPAATGAAADDVLAEARLKRARPPQCDAEGVLISAA